LIQENEPECQAFFAIDLPKTLGHVDVISREISAPNKRTRSNDDQTGTRLTSGWPTIRQRAYRIPRMRRIAATLGSAIFLVIAPRIVAGYVPWRICRWHHGGPPLGISLFRFFGVLLIAAGLPILLDSFARFALQGLGTPAPVFPTRHLVVSGLFRYVRNPMHVAVVSLILGQGLFFGSVRVLEYGITVWMLFHLFVLIYEEPTLRKTYGPQYEQFCANVPRWIPRLRPWRRDRVQD